MAADSNAQYADPGYVLFHREATLFAQPFDAKKLELRGDPLHIADQVAYDSSNGRGDFNVSQKGALVYFQDAGTGGGSPTGRGNTNNNFQWGWVSRTPGKPLELAGEQKVYGDMDLSPDEKLIAVTQSDAGGAVSDIWVIEWQAAGRSYRLTTDPGDDYNPVFERPKGERIAFTTYRKGNADIYIKNANGTGPETPLLESPNNESIEAWSQDGKHIAYKLGPEGSEDIWTLSLEDKKATLMVEGPYHKDEPQFSYDGKWLAYASDESAGVWQVYVVSFPGREQKIKVSTNGGSQPRWREDGKELFFRSQSDNEAMVVDITTPGGKISAGVPKRMFTAPQGGTTTRDPQRHQWAVTRDGQKFLLRSPAGQVVAVGGQVSVNGTNFTVQQPGTTGQGAVGAQGYVYSGLTVIRNWRAAFQKETTP